MMVVREYLFIFATVALINCAIANIQANHTQLPDFPALSEKCNTICFELYEPVCGQNGDSLRIFTNECFLMVANCKSDQKYTKVDLSKCEQPLCPNLNQPTCATNGRKHTLFNNRCSLNLHNCRFKQSYRPVQNLTLCNEALNVCPTTCPAIYDPVCGKSGNRYMRFGNSCELGVHNCKFNDNFVIAKKGDCGDIIGIA